MEVTSVGSTVGASSASSLSSRLLKPMVASRTRKTSYPALLISPIASAIRSDSESDSLIAFPRSCIKLLRRSSKFGPFLRAFSVPDCTLQLRDQTFPDFSDDFLDCTGERLTLQAFPRVLIT